jgi:hypothetical protein
MATLFPLGNNWIRGFKEKFFRDNPANAQCLLCSYKISWGAFYPENSNSFIV